MRTLIVLLSATLAVGCKDKPKAQPTAGSQATAPGSGSGSAKGAKPPDEPIANPGSGKAGPKVITLPKSEGKPPQKVKKLTKETFDKLAKLEFPESFIRDIRQLTDKGVELKYATKERPKISVIVNVTPCFDCVPMDLAKWQAKKDSLKVYLVPELRDHKDTQFEVGATELHGAKLIYTYQIGWAFGKDPSNDQQMGAYSHAYNLHYNDGVNQIRVIAAYADDPVESRDAMIALAPKEDLETFAKRFLEAFTQAWAK